jgi:inner membrane transporter RhtA
MPASRARNGRLPETVQSVPPSVFILSSAVFHYLGPSLAFLLFARVSVLGVAWLRIASAALVFAAWRRPWRVLRQATPARRRLFVALALLLTVMNSLFYLAIDRLPLSTVGAIEFLGVIVLAAVGTRTWRNVAALALAVIGVAVLTDVRIQGQPLGFLFAFGNCAGFMLYVVLGHRIASSTSHEDTRGNAEAVDIMGGIDQLGASMLIAAVFAAPVGLLVAAPAFTHPLWLVWGAGVGICSSVVPYVTDQLAMARLPRATFAFLLALLPVAATVIGLAVLRQVPTWRDLLGIAGVVTGIALHSNRPAGSGSRTQAPVTLRSNR